MAFYMAVALGGALGAISRHWLMNLIRHLSDSRFPWGTFSVNVLGSLAMGLLFLVLTEKTQIPPEWRALILVGFLGAFTTFSTYSLDALVLIQQGYPMQAAAYLISSVLVCLAAAAAGMSLARMVL